MIDWIFEITSSYRLLVILWKNLHWMTIYLYYLCGYQFHLLHYLVEFIKFIIKKIENGKVKLPITDCSAKT